MTLSKTARACLAAGAVSAGITAAAGPGFAIAAVEKAQNVFVTNTDSTPVPTKAIGTTRSNASGSTITIHGDPSAAPVPVEVTNEPGAAQTRPYQKWVRIFDDPLGQHSGVLEFVDVPADERLTITSFTGISEHRLRYVELSEGCDAGNTTPEFGGYGGSSYAVFEPSATGARQTFNQPTTFVLDPGSCGFIKVEWDEDPGGHSLKATIMGYTTKVTPAEAANGEGD